MNSKIQVFYNKLKRDQVLLLKTVNDFLDRERVSIRNGVPRRNCIRELQDVIKTSKGKPILNTLLEYALESDILHMPNILEFRVRESMSHSWILNHFLYETFIN